MADHSPALPLLAAEAAEEALLAALEAAAPAEVAPAAVAVAAAYDRTNALLSKAASTRKVQRGDN